MEPPTPNLLPDPLRCTGTDGGREAHKQLAVSIADQTGPETETQEIKRLTDLGCVLFANVTTNNLRLLWVQLKLTLANAVPDVL